MEWDLDVYSLLSDLKILVAKVQNLHERKFIVPKPVVTRGCSDSLKLDLTCRRCKFKESCILPIVSAFQGSAEGIFCDSSVEVGKTNLSVDVSNFNPLFSESSESCEKDKCHFNSGHISDCLPVQENKFPRLCLNESTCDVTPFHEQTPSVKAKRRDRRSVDTFPAVESGHSTDSSTPKHTSKSRSSESSISASNSSKQGSHNKEPEVKPSLPTSTKRSSRHSCVSSPSSKRSSQPSCVAPGTMRYSQGTVFWATPCNGPGFQSDDPHDYRRTRIDSCQTTGRARYSLTEIVSMKRRRSTQSSYQIQGIAEEIGPSKSTATTPESDVTITKKRNSLPNFGPLYKSSQRRASLQSPSPSLVSLMSTVEENQSKKYAFAVNEHHCRGRSSEDDHSMEESNTFNTVTSKSTCLQKMISFIPKSIIKVGEELWSLVEVFTSTDAEPQESREHNHTKSRKHSNSLVNSGASQMKERSTLVQRRSLHSVDRAIRRRTSTDSHCGMPFSKDELLFGVTESGSGGRAQQRRLSQLFKEVELLATKRDIAEIILTGNDWIFEIHSQFRRRWDYLHLIAVAYIAVSVPLRLGFNIALNPMLLVLDTICDFCFMMDVLFNFRTAFLDDSTKEEVRSTKHIALHYLKGFFVLDLISCVPVSLIEKRLTSEFSIYVLEIFRLTKFFQLSRAWVCFYNLETRSYNPATYRLVKTFASFLLISHLVACLFWCVRSHAPNSPFISDTLSTNYGYSLYASFVFLSGNPLGEASCSLEYYFEVLYLFIGIMINATIIGSAATILAQFDATAVERKKQIDSVAEFMRNFHIPASVQARVRGYIEYSWDLGHSAYTDKILQGLPPKLLLELSIILQKELLLHCPLIKTLPSCGTIALVQNLHPQICLPNDLVLKQGEVADCMYFITRGSVSAFHSFQKRDIYIVTLVQGSFFGEIGLLEKSSKRTASIVAETYSELQQLLKKDFIMMFNTFKEFRDALQSVAQKRLDVLKDTVQNTDQWTSENKNGVIQSLNQLAINSRTEIVCSGSPQNRKDEKRRSSTKLRDSLLSPNHRWGKLAKAVHSKVFVAGGQGNQSPVFFPEEDTKESGNKEVSQVTKRRSTTGKKPLPQNVYNQILGSQAQVSHSMASAMQQRKSYRRESIEESAKCFLNDNNNAQKTVYDDIISRNKKDQHH